MPRRLHRIRLATAADPTWLVAEVRPSKAAFSDDVFGDVSQLAVGVLADPAKHVERVLLVDLTLVHDDAHGHTDATVTVSGELSWLT